MNTLPLFFNARRVGPGEDLPNPDWYYLTENQTEAEDRAAPDEVVYKVQAIVLKDTLVVVD